MHDPYFSPGSTPAAVQHAEILRAVRYHRALQTARWSCPAAATAAGGATFTALCAELRMPRTAAYGGALNAYRRWVEDRVRTLPEVSATGAGAAGGS